MTRAAALSLLLAAASAAPLTALAQSGDPANARMDAHVADDAATRAAVPWPVLASGTDAAASSAAPASAASAADATSGTGDDKAFEQWAAAERQRIADGRAAAYARYGQDQRACWQRFAVNACLDEARDRRRATLDALRHDELTVNAQERERRTAARLDEIARKQAENAQRDASHGAARAPAPVSSAPPPASGADGASAPQ